MNRLKHLHNLRLMAPVIVIGISTGALTGAVVTLYRFIAFYAISFSEGIYDFLKEKPVFIAAAVPVLALIALALRFIYKKYPSIKGGGISDTMGLVGGIFSFKWLRSLIGTFTLSLLNFLLGVPLGNEGPCVLMGASLGKAVTRAVGKKGEVWSRYSITGGASAGFAAATGAPMTGIIFVIEEMHRRLSPVIIIITIVSVAACRLVTQILCPVFGISPEIFHGISIPPLSVSEMWIPLVTGITLGLFSIVFLHSFRRINKLFNTTLKNVDSGLKIFSILILTLAAGMFSYSFISTGHHLTEELFTHHTLTLIVIVTIVLRTILTLSANSAGLTGGLFLPTLAVSALTASVLSNVLILTGLIPEYYYTLVVVLGLVAGMSGIMNIPFTAVVFALEALGCSTNLSAIIIAAGVAYMIAVLSHSESINEFALERRIHKEREGKKSKYVEYSVTVNKNSFAEGKELKDIFWPHKLFVLSVTHPEGGVRHSGFLQEGDILRVGCNTYDEEITKTELLAIVGTENNA